MLEDAVSEVKVANALKINDFENQISVITEEVKSLKTSFLTSFDDIKYDLGIIENTTASSNEQNKGSYSAAVAHGNVMHEFSERQRRSCNMMVFNFPQANKNDDITKSKDMLQSLLGSPVNIVSSARIGKLNKNGHQSLRLTLDSPEMVLRILRNKHKLDRSLKVFLQADLTPDQRAEVNTLKNQLRERQRNGEPNLILKYINGIPKLITKN